MINIPSALRVARQSDSTQIANLMYFEPHVHRHLDWRAPLDWLGAEEFWVLEQFGSISAVMACPPDPEGVAWLRLFSHSSALPLGDAWYMLWQNAQAALRGRSLTVAAITTTEWFARLLGETGFADDQQIVVLAHNMGSINQKPMPDYITLRPMTESDLIAAAQVDAAGFAPLWRNSYDALRAGFYQAGFAMVALVDGEIVGYQISTRNSFGTHLARLAVAPQQQGRGIGRWLVQDLLSQTQRAGLYRLSVNTQNDNRASLALYRKIGFELTGERYTVFTYQF